MALPTQSQQALIWQSYGADDKNLVCPINCDFTSYSAYTFNPSGIFRQTGTVFATGLVIDNLLNAGPVTVTIGPIVETVPPYTKTTLNLAGTSAQVVVSGTQARIFVTFFRGTYMGTTAGTNFYAAQLAAGLAVETGFVSMFAGSVASIPTGYLLCDGTAISRTDYVGLFSKIGTLYGQGDGSTTFNLPNLSSRVPIGAGTGTGLSTRGLGSSGGAEQVILSATQMPVHTHALTDPGHSHGVIDPGHTHTVNDPGHAHTVTDPGHAHGVTDNGHSHGVADSGHTHPTSDPGHQHNFSFFRADNGALVATVNSTRINNGSAPTYDTSSQGAWAYDGRANYIQNAEAYNTTIAANQTGVTVNANGTNIGIVSHAANVSVNGNGTGVTVNGNQTGVSIQRNGSGIGINTGTCGITMASAGGSGGATQPFGTVPPYTALNFVIKT